MAQSCGVRFEGVRNNKHLNATTLNRMVEASDDAKAVAALKNKRFGLAVGVEANLADVYMATTKALAEHLGREFGKPMKQLVDLRKETIYVEPKLPENPTKMEEARWGKLYDQYLRKQEKYDNNKSRVFNIILLLCEKPMKSQLEMNPKFEKLEDDSDVAGLMELIKNISYEASDLKDPSMQAASVWRTLAAIQQYDREHLVDYYNRFKAALDMADRAYGTIMPDALAKQDGEYLTKTDEVELREKNKFLAALFIGGADKGMFGDMLDTLERDFSLKAKKYPASVDEALQVLTVHSDTKAKRKKKAPGDSSFAQTRQNKCWRCKQVGHTKANCPHNRDDSVDEGERNHSEWTRF